VVVERQVRTQQPDSREAQRAALEHLEDHRKAPCRSRDRDAVVGLLLGEAERVPAVGEERAVAGAQVHVAGVELGEVSDEQHRDVPLARDEVMEASHELDVREALKRNQQVRLHVPLYCASLPARVRSEERPRTFHSSPRSASQGADAEGAARPWLQGPAGVPWPSSERCG